MPLDVVRSDNVPKQITKLQFGLLNPTEIQQMSEIEVVNRELYQVATRNPIPHGMLDRRLGVADKSSTCSTCGLGLADCVGHYGFIDLPLPVFHIGHFRSIMNILQSVCKICARSLLPLSIASKFRNVLSNPNLDYDYRKAVVKNILAQAKKIFLCPHPDCEAQNGSIKKVGPLQIIHIIDKKHFDLSPIKVGDLFSRIPDQDVILLGMSPQHSRPEHLLFTRLLVPPVCIRPSVTTDLAGSTNEDDLTVKLAEILNITNLIKDGIAKGQQSGQLFELWDFLSNQVGMFINSEAPGLAPVTFGKSKPVRALCQRLKGKHGRFRGNLSGKRVDFSGRTVISPDPNLAISEVGVPIHVAKVLTFSEHVNKYNIEWLRQLVKNGANNYPGANFLIHQDGVKKWLAFGDLEKAAKQLKFGDIVERHLMNNDVVLFNRQPSLHTLSIMAHRVSVHPHRTFRFNECVCTPYNADFDGDEMNLHVPQTYEAKAEAAELMAVQKNVVTPKNGQPLIAATQDFITCAYLITQKDVFYDRNVFSRFLAFPFDAREKIEIPPPAILKPMTLWTGKQVFSVLLRPHHQVPTNFHLEVETKSYVRGKGVECPADGYVVIRNGEHLLGNLDKSVTGGSKESLFYSLNIRNSMKVSADAMLRLSKLSGRWLTCRGFSIGVSDVTPSERLSLLKEDLLWAGYNKSNDLIAKYQAGELVPQPGCNAEQTLEAQINGLLSQIREDAGKVCLRELHRTNSPLIMAVCGSKGSTINISQMIACVGQQTVGGQRAPNGFLHRSLPHFHLHDKTPKAKGFVANSFFSGLEAPEFFFHTMAGREGLVDTAVKTAETGYMQRRLMKAFEDLVVAYDGTIRNSTQAVVQFEFGGDSLDPRQMESDSKLINFSKSLDCVKCEFPVKNDDVILTADNVVDYARLILPHSEISTVVDSSILTTHDVSESNQWKLIANCRFLVHLWEFIYSIKQDLLRFPRQHMLTWHQLKMFFKECRSRYEAGKIQPGTAIGALSAQSIGEPATQMTLKTFHFAGVASMNITLGVPRIKEIINATNNISTPLVTAALINSNSEQSARIIKGKIERTTLADVAVSISEIIKPDTYYVSVLLDTNVISQLQLPVTSHSVRDSIIIHFKNKLLPENVVATSTNEVRVLPSGRLLKSTKKVKVETNVIFALQILMGILPSVIVSGIPTVKRAVINDTGKGLNLLVEGDGCFGHVLTTPGVDGRKTTANHVPEVVKTLGIEAGRSTIIHEMTTLLEAHGMKVDDRHIMLLADLMTVKGNLLGITRFGMTGMKSSPMMLASFEKTTDHLFDAAFYGSKDPINGVSERIIFGAQLPVGTGTFQLMQNISAIKPKTLYTPPPLLLYREDLKN
ncbi:hypothetical protein RCL1_000131 [Eukaryota sp. TZLM3-RCL]